MSPRDWRLCLEDILDAIRNAQAYVRGMTYAEFADDLKTIRAAAFDNGIIPRMIFSNVTKVATSPITSPITSPYPRDGGRILNSPTGSTP